MYLRLFLVFCIFNSKALAQRIAIVGAMPEEIKLLTDKMENKKIILKSGIEFYVGKIQNQKVVVVKSGIGKVNAAYTTAILIEKFHPKSVIFSGVAGGLHPLSNPGDIVLASEVFHHDYAVLSNNDYVVRNTSPILGQKPNPMYFKVDSMLLQIAKKQLQNTVFLKVGDKQPQTYIGRIATGDVFVNSQEKAQWLYKTFEALATEMEGAALAQVCFQQNTPFLIIRSCSDNANNSAHLDFQTFLKPASENSIRLVLAILSNLN